MSFLPQLNLLRMSGYTVTETTDGFVTEGFLITKGWIAKGDKKWKFDENLVAKMNVLTGKVKAEPKKFDLFYIVGKSETKHCSNSLYGVCVAMKKELMKSGNYRIGKFEIRPKN